jgi:hypothetical protein
MMKMLVGVAAIIVTAGLSPAQAKMTAFDCGKIAPGIKNLAMGTSDLPEMVRKFELQSLIQQADGPVLEAANRAENARKALIDPLRQYQNAMEELTFIVLRCSRG